MIATVGEAFADNLAFQEDIHHMATKHDMADVRRDVATKQDMADVRRDMVTKADLHALEVRLMVRLGGLIIAIAGVTVAAVRLLS